MVKLLLTGGSSNIQNKDLCYLKLAELFEAWVDQFLVKDLQVGRVVIVDNASFHKSAKIRESIENAGCKLVFLPSYSPDLNPIEKFWVNMKRWIKSNIS
ncbi:MAG: transposase [Rickettsiales bacterium]|nr:transposase [Rickettsiales bacterium]